MSNPLISVIVPVYNAEKTLEKCLDSIIKQSFAAIEVLIIDDGSTDRSGLICDDYAEKDCRVKVWHIENRGSFAARNLALSYVKTPYLGFVDADDWLSPDMYKILYEIMVSTKADFVQCGVVNEGRRCQMKNKVTKDQEQEFGQNSIYDGLYNEVISQSVNDKLFHTSLFLGFSFAEKYYHSDAMAMMILCQSCKKVICVGQSLYHYRTDNESITRGEKNKKHLYSMEALFAVYEKMAYRAPILADFFICKEIPSMGRLFVPNHDITAQDCLAHTQHMYQLFCRHWKAAKQSSLYLKEPFVKRIYWNIYYAAPYLATLIIYVRFVLKRIRLQREYNS